jgi:hypothetical protein
MRRSWLTWRVSSDKEHYRDLNFETSVSPLVSRRNCLDVVVEALLPRRNCRGVIGEAHLEIAILETREARCRIVGLAARYNCRGILAGPKPRDV